MARIAVCVYACILAALVLPGCKYGQKYAKKMILDPFEHSDPFEAAPTSVAETTTESPTGTDADVGSLDPQMVALIESELSDVPEADRGLLVDNLSQMDPATAKHVLRALQLKRNADRASTRPAGPAGGREGEGNVQLAGGHSDGGATTAAKPPTTGREPNSGYGVNPWGDPVATGNRTAYRPPAQPWPNPAAAPAEVHASHIDQLANRLAGVRPAAAANNTPLDVSTGDAAVPGQVPSASERRGLLSGADPNRPRQATDISRERSLGARFDATPPPRIEPVRTPEEQLAQLIDDIDRELKAAQPGDDPKAKLAFVERHVLLRLLYLSNDQSERAFVPIPGIDPDEQTFWKSYLWATANYFDVESIEKPEDRAGQATTQLRDAIRALQTKARLELRNVAFCDRISSFGNYDPFEQTEFAGGKEVLVYAEVENFHSEPTAAGDYRTLLHSTAEFYGADGRMVGEPIVFGRSEDTSRNHRRDFFLAFQFALPNLAPGDYTMKLIARDELSGRTDTHSLNFRITR